MAKGGHGRCSACSQYMRTNHKERPASLYAAAQVRREVRSASPVRHATKPSFARNAVAHQVMGHLAHAIRAAKVAQLRSRETTGLKEYITAGGQIAATLHRLLLAHDALPLVGLFEDRRLWTEFRKLWRHRVDSAMTRYEWSTALGRLRVDFAVLGRLENNQALDRIFL